jgi:energy-coupling factor transporter ATP-binding protein EcfA2
MTDSTIFERPRWLRDLVRFLPLKPQFVLSGNVRDLQLVELAPGTVTAQPLAAALANGLHQAGYARTLIYDPVSGFRAQTLPGEGSRAGAELLSQLQLEPGADGTAPASLELFAEVLQRAVTQTGEPFAIIVDFASRMVVRHDVLTQTEHQAFTRALMLSHQARARPAGVPPRPFFNTTIWIVDKEGDLPDWMLIGNHRVRHIPVPRPDHRMRHVLAATTLRSLDGYREASPQAITEALDDFVDQTEGLILADLTAIGQLGRTESLSFAAIGEAVRRYKVGIAEDPWARIDRGKIRNGSAFIHERVKGQDHAIIRVLDIVKRAVTGVGAPRRGNRPRGVAFLAGPTGVGKTELAKTLTSLLFGDESAYIRFDMSEFSAEHSDQRLIGAPPGYVGYDVGGELTNAIREKPFSVVLFDEIEKAHPRILDKFLQILDDGVLTSGRGERVYFSESFLVFTSNLGIYRLDSSGDRVPNVAAEDAFGVVESKVRSEIDRHFKVVLNRPELLNRIGDNILVFDFIRPEIADEIFAGMIDDVLTDIASSQNIQVKIDAVPRAQLRALCLTDLSNGGRGIRNKVETHLVNPLARALFDQDAQAGAGFVIQTLVAEAGSATSLRLRDSDPAQGPRRAAE